MGDQYVCKECNSFNMAETAVPLSLPVVDEEDNFTCGWCAEIKRLEKEVINLRAFKKCATLGHRRDFPPFEQNKEGDELPCLDCGEKWYWKVWGGEGVWSKDKPKAGK